MPSFDKLKFTANGLALQANAQAGSKLEFSKIKLGKGNASGGISGLADLVNPVVEANIITGTLQNNVYTVQANATNERLTEGFYWTEIGLFATDNDGNEVLYAYSSTTDETDYIPSAKESSYMKRVKIAIAVGDATNIEIVMSDDTYVDALTFNEKINEIQESLSAIGRQLGGCVTTEELDEVKTEIEKQIEEANTSLSNLEKSVTEEIKSIKANYATTERVNSVNESLNTQIGNANKELSSVKNIVTNQGTTFTSNIKTINNTIGTTSISGIGDGTVKGAIAKLYQMINAIPSITSGTANPSGGEDGDVYIQHE